MKKKDIKVIVGQLRKEGAQLIQNLVIEKIVIRNLDCFIKLAIKFNQPIEQVILTETGDYVKGQLDWVYSTSFNIATYIANDENAAFLKHIIMKSPKLIHSLLEGAEVDILLEYVYTGEEWSNPFIPQQDTIVIEHDDIKVHIVDIRFGQSAIIILDKFTDKMFEAMEKDEYHARTFLTDEEIDNIMYNNYNRTFINPFTIDERKEKFS